MNEEDSVIKNKTDDELVELSGMNSPHAELLRRNTEALKSASKASDRHSVNVLILTVFLFAIASAEFILDLFPVESDSKWFKLFVGVLLVAGILYVVIKELKKDE